MVCGPVDLLADRHRGTCVENWSCLHCLTRTGSDSQNLLGIYTSATWRERATRASGGGGRKGHGTDVMEFVSICRWHCDRFMVVEGACWKRSGKDRGFIQISAKSGMVMAHEKGVDVCAARPHWCMYSDRSEPCNCHGSPVHSKVKMLSLCWNRDIIIIFISVF